MPIWIDHTHAGFVLAAYGVACLMLIGMASLVYGQVRNISRRLKRRSLGLNPAGPYGRHPNDRPSNDGERDA